MWLVCSGWKALICLRLLESELVEELSCTHRRAPPALSLIDPLKAHLADLVWWAGFRHSGRLHVGDVQKKLCFCSESFGRPFAVPREWGKVFPSSQPGNGCWQSFHRLIYPPLNPQLLFFSACATWLMERFSHITCCTKFRKGNWVESGNSREATCRCCWQVKRKKQQQHNNDTI